MLSSLSSNVVLSKARARYGKRLKMENYRDLLNCHTVGEVAAYLKSHTIYGEFLAGIAENEVHRGELESRLKQKLMEDYSSLCRYEISVGEHFSLYFIQRSEIEQILHAVLLLDAGISEEYLFSMPTYLLHHTKISLTSLSKIKNYDDLLHVLHKTSYEKIMNQFRPKENGPIDYNGIESALFTYLYSNIYDTIKNYVRGEAAGQLFDIFNSFIDIRNYVRIYRLRLFYHFNSEQIRRVLFPFGTLTHHSLDEMMTATTEDELKTAFLQTKIGKSTRNINDPDQLSSHALFRLCHHYIDFSIHPSVVLLAYVFVCELEIRDIITIVEGIRYKMPANQIQKLLTIYNYYLSEN